MDKQGRNKLSNILAVLSIIIFINVFVSLFTGVYDGLGYGAPVDIGLFSLIGSFIFSLIAVLLKRRNPLPWFILVLSIIVLIFVVWFLASFELKL